MIKDRSIPKDDSTVIQRFSTRMYESGLVGVLNYESIGFHTCIYYDDSLKYSIEKWYEVNLNNQLFAAISSFNLYDYSGDMLYTKNNKLESLPKIATTNDFYNKVHQFLFL
jgi:hypothetical protein